MRVVISGTHGSGKSTLLADFASGHAGWRTLADPFEDIDVAEQSPGAATYFAQLRIAAARLLAPTDGPLIAERGPLDFLAYLQALDDLARPGRSSELLAQGYRLAERAMVNVDLLILLPLNARDAIQIPSDEDLELRDAMDAALLELADDADLTAGAQVVEITGERSHRLAQLEHAIDR
ncbi:hypothetical protein GCM10009860_03930 [Microbacterium mitrae]|uniref:AAA family ATPase n=1 Tax=Microbacterium mitrae TaxID=664640 RepID=A0A5C8HNY4_9MICO|nr:AAA family ATPase [Microbacterium mitrae]TXK05796.1 AAA family ATPase [Microbacterium mitrae]